MKPSHIRVAVALEGRDPLVSLDLPSGYRIALGPIREHVPLPIGDDDAVLVVHVEPHTRNIALRTVHGLEAVVSKQRSAEMLRIATRPLVVWSIVIHDAVAIV